MAVTADGAAAAIAFASVCHSNAPGRGLLPSCAAAGAATGSAGSSGSSLVVRQFCHAAGCDAKSPTLRLGTAARGNGAIQASS